jgi:hypothetical protein
MRPGNRVRGRVGMGRGLILLGRRTGRHCRSRGMTARIVLSQRGSSPRQPADAPCHNEADWTETTSHRPIHRHLTGSFNTEAQRGLRPRWALVDRLVVRAFTDKAVSPCRVNLPRPRGDDHDVERVLWSPRLPTRGGNSILGARIWRSAAAAVWILAFGRRVGRSSLMGRALADECRDEATPACIQAGRFPWALHGGLPSCVLLSLGLASAEAVAMVALVTGETGRGTT